MNNYINYYTKPINNQNREYPNPQNIIPDYQSNNYPQKNLNNIDNRTYQDKNYTQNPNQTIFQDYQKISNYPPNSDLINKQPEKYFIPQPENPGNYNKEKYFSNNHNPQQYYNDNKIYNSNPINNNIKNIHPLQPHLQPQQQIISSKINPQNENIYDIENDSVLFKIREEVKIKENTIQKLLDKNMDCERYILKQNETITAKDIYINNLTENLKKNENSLIKVKEEFNSKLIIENNNKNISQKIYDELNTRNYELQNLADNYNILKMEYDSLKKEYESKLLENNLNSKNSDQSKLEEMEQIIKKKDSQIFELGEIKNKLDYSNQNYMRDISNLSSRISELQLINMKFSSEIENKKDDNKNLVVENKLNESQKENYNLKNTIQELKNNIVDLQKQIEQEKFSSKNHGNENSEQFLLLQIEETRATNNNIISELEDKNFKYKKLLQENNQLKSDNENLNYEIMSLQDQLKSKDLLENEIELLKFHNKEKENLIENLNKQMNKQSSNLVRKEAEVNSMKNDKNSSINYGHASKSLNESFESFKSDKKKDIFTHHLNDIKELKEKIKSSNFNKQNRENSTKKMINVLVEQRALFQDLNYTKTENKDQYISNTISNNTNLTGESRLRKNKNSFDLNQNNILSLNYEPKVSFDDYVKKEVKNPCNNYEINLSKENWSLINKWVESKMNEVNGFKYNLIYSSSRDGCEISKFRQLCVGKSPMIILAVTNLNKIIGGFTPIPWNIPEDNMQFINDESGKSFIFSVDLNEKYDLRPSKIALTFSNSDGPIFGLSDIEILNNFKENKIFCSGMIGSYECNRKCEELFGDKLYNIMDYEVYYLTH